MVNRRNPAAGDPYPLFDAVGRSVIIAGATGARGSAAARAPDRLHHSDQPVTAFGGVEAVGLAGRLSHRYASCTIKVADGQIASGVDAGARR